LRFIFWSFPGLTRSHGEGFGEHNFWGHGITLFDSELRVPLLISFPRLLKP
jgi:membrane-anchored protein YejM (alkaline phosphatase superfamily)